MRRVPSGLDVYRRVSSGHLSFKTSVCIVTSVRPRPEIECDQLAYQSCVTDQVFGFNTPSATPPGQHQFWIEGGFDASPPDDYNSSLCIAFLARVRQQREYHLGPIFQAGPDRSYRRVGFVSG
jgi:hypothetical protein